MKPAYFITYLSPSEDCMATYVESRLLFDVHPFDFILRLNGLKDLKVRTPGNNILLSWKRLTEEDLQAFESNRLYPGHGIEEYFGSGIKIWDRPTT